MIIRDRGHRLSAVRRINLFRLRPILNQSASGGWSKKMAKADQLARVMAFLLLGYVVTTAAAFAFTFVW